MAWKLATEAFGVTFPSAYATIAQVCDTPLTQSATVVFVTFATAEQKAQFKADMAESGHSEIKPLGDKTITLTGEAYTAFVSGKAYTAAKAAVYKATSAEFVGATEA